MANDPQSHHHLRGHRRDPHAVDVAAPAGDARGDRRRRDRRRRGGRRDRPPACARPEDGRPDQSPEAFAPFLQVDQAALRTCVINITTGGAPTMTVEERLQPGRDLQAGSRVAQHGLDEFRPLSDARPLQGLQARLGAAAISKARATSSSRTPSRTSSTSSRPAPRTAPASRSSATTSATSTSWRISSTAAWSSRRSSCRACSASSAASAPHPEDVHAHEAHRRPAVRRRVPLVGAGRRAQPDADRRAWPPPWAATCASGWRTRCGSGRASSPSRTPSR